MQHRPCTQTRLCFLVSYPEHLPLTSPFVAMWGPYPIMSKLLLQWSPKCQHVLHPQRRVERPIQFLLHIKGLKYHPPHITDIREASINIFLSRESQGMLPNQCPYGRQKVKHHKQTNKDVHFQYYDKLTVLVRTATTSWIELLMI